MPPSNDYDHGNRATTVRILLLCLSCLSVLATTIWIGSYVIDQSFHPSIPLELLIVVNLYLAFLYSQAKSHTRFVTHLLMLSIFGFAWFISLRWGESTPQGLLLYGLGIGAAVLLFHHRVMYTYVGISLLLLSISFGIHTIGRANTHLGWKVSTQLPDIAMYLGTIGVIASTTIISRNKAEHSTQKVIALERTYASFRDEQHKRYLEINRLASLGKLTVGLIHDITDGIHYAALTVESELADSSKNALGKNQRIQSVFDGLKHTVRVIESTRKYIQHQHVVVQFSPAKEIEDAYMLLRYELSKQKILVKKTLNNRARIYGDPAKFHQIITNLLMNAVEAYAYESASVNKGIKVIEVVLCKQKNKIVVSITDHAGGIAKKHLPYIFRTFFTTKDPKIGTGIGLATTKDIVETLFGGTISFRTRYGFGTTFTISIPIKDKRK